MMNEFVDTMPAVYGRLYAAAEMAEHAAIVSRRGAKPVHAELWQSAKGPILCVVAEDRPGLLALITDALLLQGAAIQSARAFCREFVQRPAEAVDSPGCASLVIPTTSRFSSTAMGCSHSPSLSTSSSPKTQLNEPLRPRTASRPGRPRGSISNGNRSPTEPTCWSSTRPIQTACCTRSAARYTPRACASWRARFAPSRGAHATASRSSRTRRAGSKTANSAMCNSLSSTRSHRGTNSQSAPLSIHEALQVPLHCTYPAHASQVESALAAHTWSPSFFGVRSTRPLRASV